MTQINPVEYTADFVEHAKKEKSPNYANNIATTMRVFTKYCEQKQVHIDLNNQYESADHIYQFFKDGWLKPHNAYLTHIRSFIEYVSEQQDTDTYYKMQDFKDKLKNKRLPDVEKTDGQFEAEWLDDEEIEAACEAGDDLAELLVRCLFETGCRRGEVAAWTPNDIIWSPDANPRGAAIKVTKAADGNGGIKDPKTQLGNRIVELTAGTADMLEAYIDTHDVAGDDHIFDLNPTLIYRKTKEAFRDAGIKTYTTDEGEVKTKVSPHWMRHNRNTRIRKDPQWSEADREQYIGNDSEMGKHYTQFDEDEVQGMMG